MKARLYLTRYTVEDGADGDGIFLSCKESTPIGAEVAVELPDGRTVSVPLSWYASLVNATPEELRDYELLGDGEGIHWPQLDEDLSVAGLLLGGNDT